MNKKLLVIYAISLTVFMGHQGALKFRWYDISIVLLAAIGYVSLVLTVEYFLRKRKKKNTAVHTSNIHALQSAIAWFMDGNDAMGNLVMDNSDMEESVKNYLLDNFVNNK